MSLRMRPFLAGLLAAAAVLIDPVPGASAGLADCQRTVLIQPEASAGEGAGRLTLEVDWFGCAAAGSVAYQVEGGSAEVDVDFVLAGGRLEWQAGETGPRRITATLVPDPEQEAELEDFTVRLGKPSPDLRVAGAIGRGRILDDDQSGPTWTADSLNCVLPGELGCLGTDCDVGFDHIYCPPPLHSNQLNADPATARWSTIDGTAVAGVDFVGVKNQLVRIPAGASRVDLPLRLLPRSAGAPGRWFQIRIYAPSVGRVVDGTAVIRLDPADPADSG